MLPDFGFDELVSTGMPTSSWNNQKAFHSIPSERVSVLFMQTHENQDSVAVSFFAESGEGLELPYSYLHPLKFIPLTNGAMPLVVLFEDGELVKEYDYISIDEDEIASFFDNQR